MYYKQKKMMIKKNYLYYVKEMSCDADNIPKEYKRKAVEFWRSGKIKTKKK